MSDDGATIDASELDWKRRGVHFKHAAKLPDDVREKYEETSRRLIEKAVEILAYELEATAAPNYMAFVFGSDVGTWYELSLTRGSSGLSPTQRLQAECEKTERLAEEVRQLRAELRGER